MFGSNQLVRTSCKLCQPGGGLRHCSNLMGGSATLCYRGIGRLTTTLMRCPHPSYKRLPPSHHSPHHRVTASGLKCCKTRGCGSIKPYHACLPCLMQCASFKRFRHYEPSHDYLLVLLRCTSISVKRACEIWSHQSLIWQIGKPAAKHEAAMSQDLWFNAIVLQRMGYCFLFSFDKLCFFWLSGKSGYL